MASSLPTSQQASSCPEILVKRNNFNPEQSHILRQITEPGILKSKRSQMEANEIHVETNVSHSAHFDADANAVDSLSRLSTSVVHHCDAAIQKPPFPVSPQVDQQPKHIARMIFMTSLGSLCNAHSGLRHQIPTTHHCAATHARHTTTSPCSVVLHEWHAEQRTNEATYSSSDSSSVVSSKRRPIKRTPPPLTFRGKEHPRSFANFFPTCSGGRPKTKQVSWEFSHTVHPLQLTHRKTGAGITSVPWTSIRVWA